MKKTMLLIFIITLFTSLSYATSYSKPEIITNMTVSKNIARVKTKNTSGAEGCDKTDWYALNLKETSEMYSMLLAAKTSNQKLFFQLIGCYEGYPNIYMIYNCEKQDCSN